MYGSLPAGVFQPRSAPLADANPGVTARMTPRTNNSLLRFQLLFIVSSLLSSRLSSSLGISLRSVGCESCSWDSSRNAFQQKYISLLTCNPRRLSVVTGCLENPVETARNEMWNGDEGWEKRVNAERKIYLPSLWFIIPYVSASTRGDNRRFLLAAAFLVAPEHSQERGDLAKVVQCLPAALLFDVAEKIQVEEILPRPATQGTRLHFG